MDDTFAYTTLRTVRIRDRKLGLTMIALQVVIFVYVVLYAVLFQQQYKQMGLVTGTVRLQLLEPQSDGFRWPDQQAPFCNGVAASIDTAYAFPSVVPGVSQTGGLYTFQGMSNVGPQGNCSYLDARMAVPDPIESGGIFLPTRVTVIEQIASPSALCTQLQSSACTWNTTASTLTYLPGASRDGRAWARFPPSRSVSHPPLQTLSFSRCTSTTPSPVPWVSGDGPVMLATTPVTGTMHLRPPHHVQQTSRTTPST